MVNNNTGDIFDSKETIYKLERMITRKVFDEASSKLADWVDFLTHFTIQLISLYESSNEEYVKCLKVPLPSKVEEVRATKG